MNVPIF